SLSTRLSPIISTLTPSLHDALPIYQVMVRNQRKDTEIDWTSRQVQVVPIQFSLEERTVYEQMISLQGHVKQLDNAFTMLTLQKRSEEHTSELQSRFDIVCRPLLELQ